MPTLPAGLARAVAQGEKVGDVKKMSDTCPYFVILSTHLVLVENAHLSAAEAEWRAAMCAEVMRLAGFAPRKLRVLQETVAANPALATALELEGRNRRVYAVCRDEETGPSWCPATHAFYPATFRARVHALLLAAHRLRRSQPAIS
ncbi:hypothetical protein ABPG75_002815 [Micractinium tetrahymenae]